MGILKSYKRQVGPVGELGAVSMESAGVGSGFMAIGDAGAKIASDYLTKMGQEMTRSQIAEVSADNKLAWDTALDEMGSMTNPKDIEDFYNKWEQGRKDDLSRRELTKDARNLLENESVGFLATTRSKTMGPGGLHHKSQIAQMDRPYVIEQNNALNGNFDAGRYGSAEEQFNAATDARVRLGSMNPDQGSKAKSSFLSEVQDRQITASTVTDPHGTIDLINKQLSGKETTWSALDSDALKSHKAYAKQVLNEQQNQTLDDLYSPKSTYNNMSKDEKLAYLDERRELELLSGKAWKAETDRVKFPPITEMRPEHNREYLDFQTALYASIDDPEAQTKVLDDITASSMPMALRNRLYDMQRDMSSPTSRLRSASFTFARETIQSVFWQAQEKDRVVPKPSWIPFTDTEFKESREDLVWRAEAEAQGELYEWMREQKEFPTEAQITAKAYEIVASKQKEYAIDVIPQRISEFEVPEPAEVLPQPEPEPAADIPEFDTEEEALASGVTGDVIIGGRSARID